MTVERFGAINDDDEKTDWAVLRVVETGFRFVEANALAICPVGEVQSIRKEPYYKVYHCPCGDLNFMSIKKILDIVVEPWIKVSGFSVRHGNT